jgi:nucleoside-triphosphatase THEP1
VQTISIDSPDELLAGLFIQPANLTRLVLISGASGSGKTTWCARLVSAARRRKLQCAGLLSPARYHNGIKTTIDLQDIRTGCRLRLAEPLGGQPKGMPVGEWDMDPAILEWGNEQLLNVPACPLLVIDELGPLEFNQHEGLTAAFGLLDSRRPGICCAVVRPELLPQAATRWSWAEILLIPMLMGDK